MFCFVFVGKLHICKVPFQFLFTENVFSLFACVCVSGQGLGAGRGLLINAILCLYRNSFFSFVSVEMLSSIALFSDVKTTFHFLGKFHLV